MLCVAAVTQAQVISAYTVEATQGTYTEITDGTVMNSDGMDVASEIGNKAWHLNGIATELETVTGFPIGFDFTFNDTECNQFVIGTNGYIALGRDNITIDPSGGAFIQLREEGADNTIGIVPNADIIKNETTEISYKLLGETPNRTLVVQYKDWGVMLGWNDADLISFNYQIRLNETSNTIEFVLGDAEGTTESNKGFRMGLRGYNDDQFSLAEGEEEGMLNFIGTADDNQPKLDLTMFVNGLTYTFNPPADCVEPTCHLQLQGIKIQSYSFSMEWHPLDGADKALIVLAETSWLTQEPQDGVFYAEGDELGGGTVLAFTNDTVYEPDELELKPSTEYYIHAYTANTLCSNGPLYDSGILASFTTNPAGPESIAITNTTANSLTFDVVGNEAGDDVLVIVTDIVTPNPPYANEIEFGEPSGEYQIGDIIDGKGRVVYFGPSAEGVVVNDLEPGTAYYLRAHSYNADNDSYSTEVAEDKCSTTATVPYSIDLTYTNLQDVPAGWESTAWKVSNMSSGYGDDNRQFTVQIKPNVTNGYIGDLTTPKIIIDKEETFFSFEYCMYYQSGYVNREKYDEWEANDKLAVQVSRNGGEFEDVNVITSENNVKVDSINQFIPVNVDLSEYLNDEIRIRIHWECFSSNKVKCPIEDISVAPLPEPVIPEVTVSGITHNNALVTWLGQYEDFEVAYAKSGEEFTTEIVEAAKELALTELEAETEYQVKVRGIIAEEEYSEWSEVVTFTTAAWPECDAPTELAADVTLFAEEGTVTLTWSGNEEHLSWEVRYRDANSTSWETVENIEETTVTLENLTDNTKYLWNVRAYCVADRVTSWSAQSSFETAEVGPSVPAAPVASAIASNDTVYVSWDAVENASGYNLYYGDELLDSYTNTTVSIHVYEATEYCFTVTAYNDLGESEHSNKACATVEVPEGLEVPAAPTLTATLEDFSVVLKWNPVETAAFYTIYLGNQMLGSITGTEQSFMLPEPGKYCFSVTASNLAGESLHSNDACVILGDGIAENETTFNVYPNPVKDMLFIETEAAVEEVSVYDVYGRLQVTETPSHQDVIRVDVTDLNSGIYFVKVRTENGEAVKRILKF